METTGLHRMPAKPAKIAVLIILIFVLNPMTGLGADSRAQKIDELMSEFESERHFQGAVLVAEDGQVLYEKAFGMADFENRVANTPGTKFRIASMSKQFAAALAMIFIREGKLGLNDHVGDFFPDYPGQAGSTITVHHLLSHTSGIIQGSPLKGAYAENKNRFNTRDELLSCFQDSALLFEPGTGYQYSNYNYNLLAMILEKVGGKSYPELLQTKIFDPLHMSSTGVKENDSVAPPFATGYEYGLLKDPEIADYTHPSMSLGAGDIYSTVGDLYRWDQALYADQLISDSIKQLMFTPYTNRYGYGWQIMNFPVGNGGDSISVVFHDGANPGYESIIVRIPQDGRLVVILCNGNEPWLHIKLARPKYDIAPTILAVLYDKEYQLPRKSAAQAIAVEDTLADDYDIEKGFTELYTMNREEYVFDAEEFYCVGLCYAWEKMYHKTRGFLKIAVEELSVDHLSNAWQCHNVYGESLFMSGLVEEGCAQFERSLELNPGNSFAVRALKAAEPYRKSTGE